MEGKQAERLDEARERELIERWDKRGVLLQWSDGKIETPVGYVGGFLVDPTHARPGRSIDGKAAAEIVGMRPEWLERIQKIYDLANEIHHMLDGQDPFVYTEVVRACVQNAFAGMHKAYAYVCGWIEENPVMDSHCHGFAAARVGCLCDICLENYDRLLQEIVKHSANEPRRHSEVLAAARARQDGVVGELPAPSTTSLQ